MRMNDVLARQGHGPAPTCGPHDEDAAVQKIMLENGLMSMAVVENGRLLGIVTYVEIAVVIAENAGGVYADNKFRMGAMGK